MFKKIKQLFSKFFQKQTLYCCETTTNLMTMLGYFFKEEAEKELGFEKCCLLPPEQRHARNNLVRDKVSRIGIHAASFNKKTNVLTLTVNCPGIIIGKNGLYIKSIQNFLRERTFNKNLKISIEESKYVSEIFGFMSAEEYLADEENF